MSAKNTIKPFKVKVKPTASVAKRPIVTKRYKRETQLYIGAHPDDVELGCGGTMIRSVKEGNRVIVAFLSDGEQGLNVGVSNNRVLESTDALLSIGVNKKDIYNFNIPDTHFIKYRNRVFHEIEKLCLDKSITTVFTHTNKEYHQDHKVVHDETLRAARNVANIFLYESNAHTYPAYSPALFVDITTYIDAKLDLLNHHVSQKNREYFLTENVLALAKFRGNQSRRCRFAESFEVVRIVH